VNHSGILGNVPLPDNLDAERFVLGACLSDATALEQTLALLTAKDFALEKNKRIYAAIGEVFDKGTRVDRVTVAERLRQHKQLESVDGLSYIVSLDEGMPSLANIDSYIEIVRNKSILRTAIVEAYDLIEACLSGSAENMAYLARAERVATVLSEAAYTGTESPKMIGEIVESHGGINQFLSPDRSIGIRIPIRVLDATFDGLRKAKLYVWAGRPGEGKTALMFQCAESAAKQGYTTLVISKEMEGRDLIHRALCGQADVSSYNFRKGKLSPGERQRITKELEEMISLGGKLLIYDKSHCTTQKIRFMLRQLAASGNPVRALFVDYVQIIDTVGDARGGDNPVARISKDFVKIKKEFDIPVVLLSQLNREGDAAGRAVLKEDEEPQMRHIAESDQLVRDADGILLLWQGKKERQRHEANPHELVAVTNWKIAKNRDGMKNRGGINADGNDEQGLHFMKKRARFIEDLATYNEEAA
jgi:replicative DNA helicase